MVVYIYANTGDLFFCFLLTFFSERSIIRTEVKLNLFLECTWISFDLCHK